MITQPFFRARPDPRKIRLRLTGVVAGAACAAASAQSAGGAPGAAKEVVAILAALVLIGLLACAFILGRRGRVSRRAPPFAQQPELIDELDTENTELTARVRQLMEQLESLRKYATTANRVRGLEKDKARLEDALAGQKARNETLKARLAGSPAGVGPRPWPPGHERVDRQLGPEDGDRDDETTVARLNRKLVLARNTIAELLEAQRSLEDEDARAMSHGEERDPRQLDESALRIELKRARRRLSGLQSEMQMQRDVIHALESDAVELKRVEQALADKISLEKFLQDELSRMMAEVSRLKARLADRGGKDAEGDDDADPELLQAMARDPNR